MVGFADEVVVAVFLLLVGFDDFAEHPGDLLGGNFVDFRSALALDDLAEGDGAAHGCFIAGEMLGDSLFAEGFPAADDAGGVIDLEGVVLVLEQVLDAGADVGAIDGEDEDFVIGEELELHGLGEGDEVELFPVVCLIVHVVENNVLFLGSGLCHVSVNARGGRHVESLRGTDEGGIVDFYEVAFLVVLEDLSGGAVGFIADDEIEVRHAVEVLCAADDIDGMVGGEDDGHVPGVVAFPHLVGEALGIGGSGVLQLVGEGLDDVLVLGTFFPDLGIGADGEGAERDGAFLRPLGEGLRKEVQAGDEEEDALAGAGDVLGNLERGEGFPGAAGHDELAAVGGFETFGNAAFGAGLVGTQLFLFPQGGGLGGRVFLPIDAAVFEIEEGDLADGRGLAFEGMLGVLAPVVGGGDDDAVAERGFPGGGEEAVDVGFPDALILGKAFALDGVELAGAGDFRDEVDASVLGDFPIILRPIGKQPDIGVEIREFRLIAEIGADQFLEVGALLALGLGGGAVGGEDFLEVCH